MRFGILGPLDVSDAGGRVEVPGRRRRLLLVRLLVAANEVVPADVLLDDVWADAPRPRTSSTLTSHVQTLRRLVGRDRVVTGDGGYRVYVDVDELDVDAFDADVVAGRRALSRTEGRSAVEALARALAVWRGPALADAIGIGWADRHAARLEESRRTTIESLLDARLLLGEHHELVADAEVAVRDEPFRERRWAVLMLALYRSGRQADALRAYQRLRGVLGSEVGIAPSAALSWLDAAILRHDALLDTVTVDELADAPNSLATRPVRVEPAAPSRHSLPLPRDELVGRDRELAELPRMLNASRLVTLTGVGGIGKTRLAIETASRIGERFDTAAFVDLTAVSDPSHVVAAAVTALQVAVPSRADPTEALLATLRDRNTLLLLDNAEHLLAAVGGLVDLILERCPTCHVLVTSRQPLHLRGEHIWQVAPLDATTGAELFIARLGGPIDEERSIELCRRLDGIPLAIELAAATCRTVGVADLVERLDTRFDLLLGQQSPAGRHASLRATLEWSHALLSVAERQLLRRLAVFTGSFTLRAVEAICGPLDSSRPVAAVLAALVDKSLVVFEPASGRHRLLETVRLFAVEQLDAEETIGVHDAHATWYRDELLAQPWVDVTTLHPFVPEAPNLLAAADWCAVQGRQHDVVVLLSRSAGVWVELMHEAHVAERALVAYEQCHDELSAGEDAIACAFFGVSLAKGRVWRQRGVDRDPQLECRQARSNAVALGPRRRRPPSTRDDRQRDRAARPARWPRSGRAPSRLRRRGTSPLPTRRHRRRGSRLRGARRRSRVDVLGRTDARAGRDPRPPGRRRRGGGAARPRRSPPVPAPAPRAAHSASGAHPGRRGPRRSRCGRAQAQAVRRGARPIRHDPPLDRPPLVRVGGIPRRRSWGDRSCRPPRRRRRPHTRRRRVEPVRQLDAATSTRTAPGVDRGPCPDGEPRRSRTSCRRHLQRLRRRLRRVRLRSSPPRSRPRNCAAADNAALPRTGSSPIPRVSTPPTDADLPDGTRRRAPRGVLRRRMFFDLAAHTMPVPVPVPVPAYVGCMLQILGEVRPNRGPVSSGINNVMPKLCADVGAV